MSRRRILVTALVAGLLTSLAPSQAAWQTPAGGWGFSNSTAVGPGSSPSPAAGGRTVSLTWPAATLDSGAPVGGYVVRRYDLGTSTELPIATGTCASLVATTSSTHSAAPPGSWRYTITGAQGAWRGAVWRWRRQRRAVAGSRCGPALGSDRAGRYWRSSGSGLA